MSIKIRNWNKFQHYGDSRRPIWIKLYRELLDDVNWHELDPLAAKCLVMMWLIASENDGNLPDSKALAFRLRISQCELKSLLSQLNNFLVQDASNLLADGYQDASLYKEKEIEKEKEKDKSLDSPKKSRSPSLAEFDLFWKSYPRREGKGRAEKAWAKAVQMASPEKIVEAARTSKFNPDKQFVPLPATWLNDRRWEDESHSNGPPRPSQAEMEEQERKRIAHLMKLAGIEETNQ